MGVIDGTRVSALVGLGEGVGVPVGIDVSSGVRVEMSVAELAKVGVGVWSNWINRTGKLQLRRKMEVINRTRGMNTVYEYLDLSLCIIHKINQTGAQKKTDHARICLQLYHLSCVRIIEYPLMK